MNEHCNDDEILAGLAKEPPHPDFEYAIKCLYEKCYPKILNYVRDNSGSVEDAEDLFQDVLSVLLKKIHTGSLELTTVFCKFLLGIARNRWLTKLKNDRKFRIAMEELPIDATEAEKELTESELRQARELWLFECLKKLGDRCQEILDDFYVKKMSMSEIALKHRLKDADNAKQEKLRCMNRLRGML